VSWIDERPRGAKRVLILTDEEIRDARLFGWLTEPKPSLWMLLRVWWRQP
jgi:hypothetical protein